MRSAELAYENRLASTGGRRVEQLSPRPLPLAGFALTTIGRFWGTTEAIANLLPEAEASLYGKLRRLTESFGDGPIPRTSALFMGLHVTYRATLRDVCIAALNRFCRR